jgi:NCAIR mutase (PurE)-related protein
MVDEQRLRRWMVDVRTGKQPAAKLLAEVRRLPFDRLGDARLDTHRALRRGLPETVLAEGKSPDQLRRILARFHRTGDLLLVTRLDAATFAQIRHAYPGLRYDPLARLAFDSTRSPARQTGLVPVVTGGTSDVPVAAEAAKTLEIFGSRTARLYDVGVAGVHRLLAHWDILQRANAIIVVAGMEGALASVVAGLVACPVVAVPTSIGYGAQFHGLAPLLTMINSCVPGVGVVNIDNGFGAAYLAHVINQPKRLRRRT